MVLSPLVINSFDEGMQTAQFDLGRREGRGRFLDVEEREPQWVPADAEIWDTLC